MTPSTPSSTPSTPATQEEPTTPTIRPPTPMPAIQMTEDNSEGQMALSQDSSVISLVDDNSAMVDDSFSGFQTPLVHQQQQQQHHQYMASPMQNDDVYNDH